MSIRGSSLNNRLRRSFFIKKSGRKIRWSIGKVHFYIGNPDIEDEAKKQNPAQNPGGGTGDGNGGGGHTDDGDNGDGGNNGGPGGGGTTPSPTEEFSLLLLDEALSNVAYSGDRSADDVGIHTLQDKFLNELNTTATLVGYTFIATASGSRKVTLATLVDLLEQ
jgi:hypothetical protein